MRFWPFARAEIDCPSGELDADCQREDQYNRALQHIRKQIMFPLEYKTGRIAYILN